MTRTAANATSMAIDSTGIRKTETGGRSSRYRSAVTTASAMTETTIGHAAAIASSKPRLSCARGPIDREHHLAHRLHSVAQRPLHQTVPSHAALHGDVERARSEDDDCPAPPCLPQQRERGILTGDLTRLAEAPRRPRLRLD